MGRAFDDETALVTGASSGIGYEVARLCAADGYDVVAVSRTREDLEAVADELAADHGVATDVVAMDLARPDAAEELYEAVTETGHEVDLLVNNAGYGSFGAFLDEDPATTKELVALHATTPTVLTTLFGRDMADRGGGKVLNNASIAGWAPAPNSAVYSAAKHYERALSEALAEGLREEDITVTVLCPGETETGFFDRGGYGESGAATASKQSAATVARAGYDGVHEGERVVVPGLRNRVRVALRRVVPRSLYVKTVERSLSP